MSTWIKINSSTSKQVPDGTIGILINQTTNYYLIQHWALNKTIQEKKVNCEIYDDIVGRKYWYKDHLRRIPCTKFKVIDYAEDYDSGNGSYVQMTGKRVLLEPVNELASYRDLVEQRVIAPVADLNNCEPQTAVNPFRLIFTETACTGINQTYFIRFRVEYDWADLTKTMSIIVGGTTIASGIQLSSPDGYITVQTIPISPMTTPTIRLLTNDNISSNTVTYIAPSC